MKKKTIILLLMGCTFFGVGLVSVLFLLSEEKMQRNNAFQRRYMPHPVEKVGEYDLEYNSYYLTGVDAGTIYLGNRNAPLFLMSIDTSLMQAKKFIVAIDSMYLPFKRVKISINPPYFYVADGTVPVLFRGKIKEWKANIFIYNEAYFTQFSIADSTHIGISTVSGSTMTTTLGLTEITPDSTFTVLNPSVLTKQVDGKFDSDGILLWNDSHQQFVYTYYYQNSYEVMDKSLENIYTGRTIDTISTPVLDIAYYKATNEYKLGANTLMVNKHSATYGDYLFIHSERLGKYEDEDVLRSASIIDLYNIKENKYVFSFYLYHQTGKKLNEFRVYKNLLIVLVDDKLWLYRLKQEYF